MNILHLSALVPWGQGEKAGMPSLYECLRHYALAGHRQTLLLPDRLMVRQGRNEVGSRMPEDLSLDLPVSVVRTPIVGMQTALLIRSRLSRLFPGWAQFLLESLGANTAWLLLTAGFVRKTLNVARRGKFDLVYAHNEYSALAACLVGRLLNIPNVTRLYGTFLGRMINKPLLWMKYPIMVSGFRIPAKLLIVTNDGTGGDMVARKFRVPPGRFRYWPNGVELEDLAANDENAEPLPFEVTGPLIVTLQRHENWKRLDRLIRAIPGIVARAPEARFVLCGTGNLTDKLKRMAENLGVGDLILWPGGVRREQVRQLLSVASVLVSTNDISNRGNPVIEAIAMGCPVVTLNDGTTRDLLVDGQNCLLVTPDDDQALGEAVARIVNDASLRARLQAGAKETARRFLWTWAQRMAVEIDEVEQLVRSNVTSQHTLHKCLPVINSREEENDKPNEAHV